MECRKALGELGEKKKSKDLDGLLFGLVFLVPVGLCVCLFGIRESDECDA